jgi:hypothetical protein
MCLLIFWEPNSYLHLAALAVFFIDSGSSQAEEGHFDERAIDFAGRCMVACALLRFMTL